MVCGAILLARGSDLCLLTAAVALLVSAAEGAAFCAACWAPRQGALEEVPLGEELVDDVLLDVLLDVLEDVRASSARCALDRLFA